MPNVTIDLKNLEEIKNTLVILQDIFNDERLPKELYIKYSQRFNKIWDKNLKTEELTMSEEVKTDEELDEEYYDWYCNIVHSQIQELSEEEEYMYQKWYDENELNFRNLKNNGHTDRAIMKKAYVLGLSVKK